MANAGYQSIGLQVITQGGVIPTFNGRNYVVFEPVDSNITVNLGPLITGRFIYTLLNNSDQFTVNITIESETVALSKRYESLQVIKPFLSPELFALNPILGVN